MVMKKIKLPLEMANGVAVRTLEELKENWDLEKILNHFLTGRLLTWLNDRYYSDISEKILKLDVNTDSLELQKSICDIFGVKYDVDSSISIDDINEKNRRLEIIRQYTDIDTILKNIDKVAFDQEEMACLLDANEPVIYLFNNTFSIPLSVHDKKYVGIGNAEVVIKRKALVDFDSININFENISFDYNYNQLLEKSPDNLYKMGSKAEDVGDVEKALEYYKKVAVLNDSRGWFKLGWFYSNGICVKKDYEKAMQNYLKAAEMGNSSAMNNIGAAYANGEGVEKNLEKALVWYKKAAEAGNTFSCKNIADMYYRGDGVKEDDKAAFEWYQKAYDNAYASYMLGWMYEFGQGTVKDIDKAQEYYKKAADGNYYNSTYKWDPTFRLARIYFDKYNKQVETVEVLNKYYDDEKKNNFIKGIGDEINNLSFPYTSAWLNIYTEWIAGSSRRDGYNQLNKKIEEKLNQFYKDFVKDINDNTNRFINDVYEVNKVILIARLLYDLSATSNFENIKGAIINDINTAIDNINMPSVYSVISDYDIGNEPINTGSFFHPSYGFQFDYHGDDVGKKIQENFKKDALNMVDKIKAMLQKDLL